MFNGEKWWHAIIYREAALRVADTEELLEASIWQDSFHSVQALAVVSCHHPLLNGTESALRGMCL